MKLFPQKKNVPVETTPPAKQLTSTEWRSRIAALEAQAAQAQENLQAARNARRDASGRVIVYNESGDSLKDLVSKERECEVAAENLDAAIQLARGELQRAEAAEEAAAKAERQRVIYAIGAQILESGATVDNLLMELGAAIHKIEPLYREYRNAGGRFEIRMKPMISRASRRAGLRDYITDDFVGDAHHFLPLTKQWAHLAPPQSVGSLSIARGFNDHE
jgi:hypothetical protein